MSVRTRVGMVATLCAATSLLLVVALTQGATDDAAFHPERSDSSDPDTYVALDAILKDDPADDAAASPAVGETGDPFSEPTQAPSSESVPAPPPWRLPESRVPPLDPYFVPPNAHGSGDTERPHGETEQPANGTQQPPTGGSQSPPTGATQSPLTGGTQQPGAGTPAPPTSTEPSAPETSGGEPAVGEPGVPDVATPAPVVPTQDPVAPKPSTPDGSAATGPVDETAPGGESTVTPPPETPESATLNGVGAPTGAPTDETPTRSHPPSDVLVGIEPPPAELLPPPANAPDAE